MEPGSSGVAGDPAASGSGSGIGTECGMCGKALDDPRSLPCRHAFCYRCLDGRKQRPRRLHKRGSFKVHCPTCRAKHLTQQVSAFPSSTVHTQAARNGGRAAKADAAGVKCTSHPANDVEQACTSHKVLVCKTCALYQHRKCGLAVFVDAHNSWRAALVQAYVKLGETHLLPTCSALRLSRDNLQRVHTLGSSARLQIAEAAVAGAGGGLAEGESSTATEALDNELEKCEESYQLSRSLLLSVLEQCVPLCERVGQLLEAGDTEGVLFLQQASQELTNIGAINKSETRPATVWKGPREFVFDKGHVTVVNDNSDSYDNQQGPVSTPQSSALDGDDMWKALEREAETIEKSEGRDLYPDHQDGVSGVLRSVASCRIEFAQLLTAQASDHPGSTTYEERTLGELQHQQAKSEERRKVAREASADQHEHLRVQSQRADSLRRQREEKQGKQRQEILEERAAQQARQEEQRRKAREAKEQTQEERLRKQREVQQSVEQQKQRQVDEYNRRQDVRHQQEEQHQQQHDQVKGAREEEHGRKVEEQKHLLEEFHKQQSVDMQQQLVSLQERSTQQMSKQQEETDQVNQVLQKRQEKQELLKQAHHDDPQVGEPEHRQKLEQKQLERQEVLRLQQHDEQLKEQQVRNAMEKKRESRQHQLEEIAHSQQKQNSEPHAPGNEGGNCHKVQQQEQRRKLETQKLQEQDVALQQQAAQRRQKQETLHQQLQEERRRQDEVQHAFMQQQQEKQHKARDLSLSSAQDQQEWSQKKRLEALQKQREVDAEHQEIVEQTLLRKQQNQKTLQKQLSQ